MQRIHNSLAAKVFLWMLCALTLCGLLIYSAVMVLLPRQYTALSDNRVAQEFELLTQALDGADYEAAGNKIYSFCIRNHTTAVLTTGEETLMFGGGTSTAENTASVSAVVQFSDISESSMLTVLSSASTAHEITRTFFRILPLITVLILLVSAFSAWLCSRAVAKPVVDISGVAKRMAKLDMTWRCAESRTDELGDLAKSLNTLSQRLTQAMGALEAANDQLKRDIAASQALEKQRRDFFAAASHELKTPVTILKGQLESMSLGIGDYRNHEKYLPQALAAAERMEALIQEVLAIAKMETGIPEASFTEEPIAPILRACAAEMESLAWEKQITVDTRQVSDSVCARIHRRLFPKAVSSLLSNAIRYSPPGQHVVISLSRDALTVENTGAFIEEDALPLLFAPFYRVEQSRSRQSGGSGLGLYLAKTILDLHGFGLKIENVPDAVRVTVQLR